MKTSKCLNKKRPAKEYRSTVTELHESKMKEFDDYYATLPKKQKELKKLQKKFEQMDKNDYKIIRDRAYLKEEIQKLEEEIKRMISKEDCIQYLNDSHHILFKISQESNKTIKSDKYKDNNLTKFVNFKGVQKRGSLMEEYLQATGQSVTYKKRDEIEDYWCKECKSYMILDEKTSHLVCENCGITKFFFDTYKEQWSDEVEIITPYSYRRQNHFEDHLKRLQAKESKTIPNNVINNVLRELSIRKINDASKIDEKLIKSILKKLELSSYYDNINTIICIITGKKPLIMSKELEEKLKVMFNSIQDSFERHKNLATTTRTNFLSYSYTINKMLRIIGEKDPSVLEFVPKFKLLKSRDKLILQDKVWCKICKDMNWTFMPSV